ncbi:major facilitator superfamily domain-containing protein [Mycena floridula]|nr:major facilitator superfamily domain-containing protein [Mycena floridula]
MSSATFQQPSDDEKDLSSSVAVSQATPSSSALVQNNRQITVERIHAMTLYWSILVTGWNDGTTGPLLPRLQLVYNVGYTTVSLLFVCATIGFISGAFLNVPLSDRFTFGQLMVLGASLQAIAYAIDASAPPFEVLCLGYAINGIGMAIQDGQANGYVSLMKRNPEKKMGILHAAYGLKLDNFCSPCLPRSPATQFAQLKRWSFHYLVSLGLALSNVLLLILVFKLRSADACLADIGQDETVKSTNTNSSFRQILRFQSVHLLSFYILIYVGLEATIGSWIVTYVIQVRDAGPSSGYISTGFFGGIMLGRVLLLKVNEKVGEHRVLFLYFFIALGMELVIWFVPSVVGNAIAAALLGFIIGPWYPIAMNFAARIIPPWLIAPSMGWIAGFGQAGSALFPFITGAVAQKVGNSKFSSLCDVIGIMVMVLAIWTLVLTRTSSQT